MPQSPSDRLINRITALHRSLQLDEGGKLSTMERDLMLGYLRELYEIYATHQEGKPYTPPPGRSAKTHTSPRAQARSTHAAPRAGNKAATTDSRAGFNQPHSATSPRATTGTHHFLLGWFGGQIPV